MKLQESGEMYLETILRLSKKQNKVRSIDIVDEMNYSKPSVSRAIKILKEHGYITVNPLGYITLTNQGLEVAEKIYHRHQILTDCFISLGIEEPIAANDACRIEHVISQETFDAIEKHMKKK